MAKHKQEWHGSTSNSQTTSRKGAAAPKIEKQKQKTNSKKIFISSNCNPQTIDLIKTRTNPFGLELIIGDEKKELTKINEDIITSKCAFCHYEGSSYTQTSNLNLEPSIAYNQLINRIPDNESAKEDGLILLSDAGGLLGLLTSYFWEKVNVKNELHFYSNLKQTNPTDFHQFF